jgi:hypothetical protein
MFKLYWGAPANPGQMKFHTGTLLSKPTGQPRMAVKQFVTHRVLGLFGLQIGKSFIGRISLGEWGGESSQPEPWEPKHCEGYDDPEDRCPRDPEECVCWQGRTGDHP